MTDLEILLNLLQKFGWAYKVTETTDATNIEVKNTAQEEITFSFYKTGKQKGFTVDDPSAYNYNYGNAS
jgi:hypothetical protein